MANGTENKEKKSKNLGAYSGGGAYGGGTNYYKNPGGYSSPNIAVGGSYQQIREGIVDTGQFQKGFEKAFKFQPPKPPELLELDSLEEGNYKLVGGKSNQFTGGNVMKTNLVFDQAVDARINEWNVVFQEAQVNLDEKTKQRQENKVVQLNTDLKKWVSFTGKWDDDMFDHEVSMGINMYGVGEKILKDRNNNNIRIEDVIKSSNMYPGDVDADIIEHDGANITVMRMKHHKTGEIFEVDLTSLDTQRLDELFALKHDRHESSRDSYHTKEGATFAYKTNFDDDLMWKQVTTGEETTVRVDGNDETFTNTKDTQLLSNEYINNRQAGARIHGQATHEFITDPHIPSAFNSLYKRVVSERPFEKFELSQESLFRIHLHNSETNLQGTDLVTYTDINKDGKADANDRFELNVAAFKQLKESGRMAEFFDDENGNIQLGMLQDEAANTWLVDNNYDGFRLAENGRAESINERLYKESTIDKIKPSPESGVTGLTGGQGRIWLQGLEDVLTLQQETNMNTYGQLLPEGLGIDNIPNNASTLVLPGFRASVNSMRKVMNDNLIGTGVEALFGQQEILNKLHAYYQTKEGGMYNEEAAKKLANNKVKEYIGADKNRDLFIWKGAPSKVSFYNVGVEKADQISGVMNILSKELPTGSERKGYVNAWFNSNMAKSETAINTAVDNSEIKDTVEKSGIYINDMTLDEYAKSQNLSENQKKQIKYRVLRNVVVGKEKKKFLYGDQIVRF